MERKEILQKDLKIGDIVIYNTNYIIEVSDIKEVTHSIYTNVCISSYPNNPRYNTINDGSANRGIYHECTPEEIEWFKQCKKVRMIVPKIDDYEIY